MMKIIGDDMKAYLILDLSIHDLEKFLEYIQRIPAIIQKHSGKYLVQGDVPPVIEGDWQPERLVVIEFPDHVTLQNWFHSEKYQSLIPLRDRAADVVITSYESYL